MGPRRWRASTRAPCSAARERSLRARRPSGDLVAPRPLAVPRRGSRGAAAAAAASTSGIVACLPAVCNALPACPLSCVRLLGGALLLSMPLLHRLAQLQRTLGPQQLRSASSAPCALGARRIRFVVVTWVDSLQAFDQLVADYSDVADFVFLHGAPKDELLREIVGADCCIGIPDAAAFRAARLLRWIHQPFSGVNFAEGHPIIDSEVVLTNTPDAHVPPMAEWVLAMMLCWAQRLEEHLRNQRNRRWAPADFERPREGYWGNLTIAGSTVGILGATGGLGEAIAARVAACGAIVYGVARTARESSPVPGVQSPIWGFHEMEKMLPMVDWLVVACPLTPETKGLVGAHQLALMRPSARILVLSRGSIVEERALVDALERGALAGAAFDSFSGQELRDEYGDGMVGWMPARCPLWDHPGVIITPHTSASSPLVTARRGVILRENIEAFLHGEEFPDGRVRNKALQY